MLIIHNEVVTPCSMEGLYGILALIRTYKKRTEEANLLFADIHFDSSVDKQVLSVLSW